MKPTRLAARSSRNGVLVLGMRVRQVADHVAQLVGVRPGPAHALLRLAHFARRDHFHGARDLLRVLHALDLGANFFTDGHLM